MFKASAVVSTFSCIAAQNSNLSAEILTSFLFVTQSTNAYFETELSYSLKSANLYLTAVYIEPFSTSVF